jgi:hypothetical protein
MSTTQRTILRTLLGLVLAFTGLQPLRAQLDTRLQSGNTDFLDMYQQSTSQQAKPEIATIFDASASMNSLMFHPLYVNNDNQDADDYRWMSFTLSDTLYNQYRIVATDSNYGATATYYVKVTSSGASTPTYTCQGYAASTSQAAASSTTAPVITIKAYASADSNAQTSFVLNPVNNSGTGGSSTTSGTNPTYTISGSNTGPFAPTGYLPYTMENAGNTITAATTTPTITFTAWTSSAMTTAVSGPNYPTGTFFKFTIYMAHTLSEGENPANEAISWQTASGTAATAVTTGVFYTSTATYTIPPWSPGTANTTQLSPILVSPGTNGAVNTWINETWTAGTTTLTFSTYYQALQAPPTSGTISWVVTDYSGNSCTVGSFTTTNATATTSSSSPSTCTWTIPPYCNMLPASPTTMAYVTATLNVAMGSNYMAPGVVYLSSTTPTYNISNTTDKTGGTTAGLNLAALRKPDGTAVTAADADNAAAKTTGSNYSSSYAPYGHLDVRNWIRAASHVRFQVTTPKIGGTAYVRTIDIPIPWNIPDQTTTGSPVTNPLPDATILDQQSVTTLSNGVSTTTVYGSGLNTPIDQTYLMEKFAGAVLATDYNGSQMGTGATNTAYLYTVYYRPAYINWLFTGVYANTVGTLNNGTYANGGALGSTPGSLNYLQTPPTAGSQFIVYDANNPALVKGQASVSWGQSFGSGFSGATINVPNPISATGAQPGTVFLDTASKYTIPYLTRFQAVKKAAITTWINNQSKVYWAFRELDPANEAGASGTNTSIDNNSASHLYSGSAANATLYDGTDSAWTVLNNLPGSPPANGINATTGNSVKGMTKIAYLFASKDTPLTYAMARALAQYSDPSNIFNTVEGSTISQCVNSYLLVFTDGIDNNGIAGSNNTNNQTPYITYSAGLPASLNALQGNQTILGTSTSPNTTSIDRGGAYWNIYTFAGMAAHMADSSLTSNPTSAHDYLPAPRVALTQLENYPSSGAPDQYLPYAIPSRNGQAYTKDHLITTMTIGVSLGGFYNNPASPQANLFYAAVVGNPSVTAGSFGTAATNFHGFVYPTGTPGVTSGPNIWVPNDWAVKPTDPSDYPTIGQAADGAVYYFNGSDPAALSTSMQYAFQIAISQSGNNSTSNPNLPFVGASLGNEVYFGSFYPPQLGGVIWPGDLMMFGTQNTNGTITFIDNTGVATTNLNANTAMWDASTIMNATKWNTRNLYTRYAATSAAEPMISQFTYQGSAFTGGTDPIFKNVDPGAPLATQQAVIQFAAGGDTSTGNPPTQNRTNIMGDIINSSPASVGYNYSQVSSSLTGNLSGSNWTGFNLVLVGTNQGWLHAFGEVTQTVNNTQQAGKTMVKAAVQELWAFMPTDFLNDLEYIMVSSNTHRHMVDGTPAIYFLDLPPSSGGSGNGVIDNTERAVAIVSLGKGGRSYYALDIHNPVQPAILWSLVPDEWSYFPPSRILANGPSLDAVQKILKNFGFSTCTPAFGRIEFNGVLHDAVFLGGGFSVPEVDANFTAQAPKGLGRSVMALDVYTGQVLAAVDMTDSSIIGSNTIGPIGSGLVPFEFILNSGMAQRAYFTDYTGGLWSWGSKNVSTSSSYPNFRIDTSEMTNLPAGLPTGWQPWQIRKVFQDDNSMATVTGGTNNRYTTLPAPFVVANFPGPSYNGQALPAAVGVAMISGDHNNPLDRSYTPTNKIPQQHTVTVVFDRQDSRALALDSATGPDTGIKPSGLVALPETTVTSAPYQTCSVNEFSFFTPTCPNYFLGTSTTPKYGYFINLPSIVNNTFVPKGITSPIVVANSLFYSYFTPTTSDPCTGGTGTTTSWLIGDVMHPVYSESAATGLKQLSGTTATWVGVASNYISVGTTSVIQGGTITNPNTSSTAPATVLNIQSSQTLSYTRHPMIRVWRTVQ